MSGITYAQLALNWKPESKNNQQFVILAMIFVIAMMLIAIVISRVNVPEPARKARVEVPERIANFILQKEKPKVKPRQQPQPVAKPKPKPEPKKIEKPKVKKNIKKEAVKPLSKTQKQAREKAENSGLLALGNVLADLMDTEEVSAMIGGNVNTASSTASTGKAANSNQALLLADAAKGSGGVDVNQYASTTIANTTKLSRREITQVKQTLLSPDVKLQAKSEKQKKIAGEINKPRTAGVRSEEGITIVFDQNKSKLYSIYNRARRTNPNLKGKIILQITVAPSGKVTRIKVVSNELNDSKLESRLLKRIKQFDFGAQHVEEITVTYPIEFLPA